MSTYENTDNIYEEEDDFSTNDDVSEENEVSEEKLSGSNVDNDGDGNIVLTNSTLQILFRHYGNRSSKFVCETTDCNTELDGSKHREIICPKCGAKYYNNTSFQLNKYKSLDHKESKELNKLIAHINNKARDQQFEEAYKYCQKAEALAPAESITWEYYTLIEFLYEITKRRDERRDMEEIVKMVKSHLAKCKDYNIKQIRFDEISADIATRIYEWGKMRIPTVVLRKDKNGREIWVTRDLERCVSYMKCFDLAYSINNTDLKFLEEYVKELSKDYKWIIRDNTGLLKNRVTLYGFNPLNKYHSLINRIRKHNPEYIEPEIATERFEIIKKSDTSGNVKIISRTKL